MATARRTTGDSVVNRLAERPDRFPLFQAIRLLEQAARVGAASPAGANQPIGQDARPASEVVRLRAATGLTFPASDLQRADLTIDEPPAEREPAAIAADGQPELAVNLMGLTGPSGVLPLGYTELLVRSLRERSLAMRDFFDLFNHRIIALFYRAWIKYRLPFSYERHAGRGDDGVTQFVAGLVGLGTPRTRNRQAVSDDAIAHYSGLFAHWPRNVVGLEAMLSDYLDRPVAADQFCGRWLYLPPDVQSRLADGGNLAACNGQLGVSAIAGVRAWDVQSTIRLRIGPIKGALFEDLLPGGAAFKRLRDLVRMYLGLEYVCLLQLKVDRNAVPDLRLDGGSRLGLNAWLKSAPLTHDSSDAEFALT